MTSARFALAFARVQRRLVCYAHQRPTGCFFLFSTHHHRAWWDVSYLPLTNLHVTPPRSAPSRSHCFSQKERCQLTDRWSMGTIPFQYLLEHGMRNHNNMLCSVHATFHWEQWLCCPLLFLQLPSEQICFGIGLTVNRACEWCWNSSRNSQLHEMCGSANDLPPSYGGRLSHLEINKFAYLVCSLFGRPRIHKCEYASYIEAWEWDVVFRNPTEVQVFRWWNEMTKDIL